MISCQLNRCLTITTSWTSSLITYSRCLTRISYRLVVQGKTKQTLLTRKERYRLINSNKFLPTLQTINFHLKEKRPGEKLTISLRAARHLVREIISHSFFHLKDQARRVTSIWGSVPLPRSKSHTLGALTTPLTGEETARLTGTHINWLL